MTVPPKWEWRDDALRSIRLRSDARCALREPPPAAADGRAVVVVRTTRVLAGAEAEAAPPDFLPFLGTSSTGLESAGSDWTVADRATSVGSWPFGLAGKKKN